MRILHVIASMDPEKGGVCQGIRESNNELNKLGIEREVVCLDDPNASFLGKDFFPIYALGPSKSKWQYSSRLFDWLLLNLLNYDVVIVNGLWLYQGYAVKKVMAILQKRKNDGQLKGNILPKFYIITHGMLDPYFQRAPGNTIKAIRNLLYWKLIENKVVNGADGLLFTCETELLLAREPFRPYHPKKEINVSYGIAPPPIYTLEMDKVFKEKCIGLNNNSFLLFLSRIHEKKGVDNLIKAYIDIVKKYKDLSIKIPRLVIAGPGIDTFYGKKIQRLASEFKEFIFFPGMLTGDAKWGAFYACNAFILPSHQENFGIAVVEALACGKPVLISNQVNIWHEVKKSNSGIIADDTLNGTKRLIETWLYMDEKEKSKLADAAKCCFENNFNISLVTKGFLDAVKPD